MRYVVVNVRNIVEIIGGLEQIKPAGNTGYGKK
jgi:hypothetical protein